MLEKYISTITSPFLIIPLFGLWVIAAHSLTLNDFLVWSGTFIFFIVLIPFLYVYQGARRGVFTDLHVAIREQRSGPFLIAILSSILLIGVYYLESVPREILSLSVVVLVNGVVFYIITKLWKVSIHAASFFGSVLITGIMISQYTAFLLVFLPVIIWARVKRSRHNLWQAIASLVLVGVATTLTFYFLGIW